MRKRLPLTLCCVVGLALVGGAVLFVFSSQPGVTRANYEQIREGASLKEVEDLMGGPAFVDKERGFPSWWSDTMHIMVLFDEQDKVTAKCLVPLRATLWAKLRNRLGI